jgi:hypothetical protein
MRTVETVGRAKLSRVLLCIAVGVAWFVLTNQSTRSASCNTSSVRGNLQGEDDRVRLSLGGTSRHCLIATKARASASEPFTTHEIACSTDRQAAGEGLCSATPCPDFGRFFAFTTVHLPDGTTQPGGFECVQLSQAAVQPGISVADVFEAVRRVRLPGGEIGVEPEVRGWRISSLTSGWMGRTSRRSN